MYSYCWLYYPPYLKNKKKIKIVIDLLHRITRSSILKIIFFELSVYFREAFIVEYVVSSVPNGNSSRYNS